LIQDRDYVLGTQEEEIVRLGIQHQVWKKRCMDAWVRSGFMHGHTLLDIGCGPGHATFDLAQIVGASGKVFALDRSRRFLNALEKGQRQRQITNITTLELDLEQEKIPQIEADGAWARWVFAFVKNPRDLLERVRAALKPGGVLAIHEYFDYSTWRHMPRSPELEEFVQLVMKSWRQHGGEPNIGLDLPGWLKDSGFTLKFVQPIIDVISPNQKAWKWPNSFIRVGPRRLVELGALSHTRAQEIEDALVKRDCDPESLMITPGVLEVIAVRN
jgi:SAM-dependent methyltransferase